MKKEENIKLFYSEGLVRIPVQDESGVKVGFADKSGKWVVKPMYELADDFHDGLALVFSDLSYKFIDKDGKIAIVIKDKFVENPEDQVIFKGIPNPRLGHFSHGFCRIKEIDKWGFINKKGVLCITPAFEDVKDFTLAQ